jgi:nitrogen fixation-related uncharacterized protein
MIIVLWAVGSGEYDSIKQYELPSD